MRALRSWCADADGMGMMMMMGERELAEDEFAGFLRERERESEAREP